MTAWAARCATRNWCPSCATGRRVIWVRWRYAPAWCCTPWRRTRHCKTTCALACRFLRLTGCWTNFCARTALSLPTAAALQHTTLAGVDIPAGTVVHVNWTAANRDPRTFSHPDGFGPEENAPANIVYGAGPHACPGRALSTLELRVFTQELLNATTRLSLGGETERELPPGGGYARVPLRLE